MKQLFFDAACIGKLHWNERGSPEVQALSLIHKSSSPDPGGIKAISEASADASSAQ